MRFVKLDAHDKALLSALLHDSRMPLTQLAKRTRLSKESTLYRMRRLEREKVIRSYTTEVDIKRLGMQHFSVWIAFHKVSSVEEQAIFKTLLSCPNFSWIGPVAGTWNVAFDAYARSREELELVFGKLLARYKQSISKYLVLPVLETHAWLHKSISSKQTRLHISKKHEVDNKDKQILAQLAHNSRLTYVELGKKAGLTPNACKSRLKSLVETGVISSFGINIDFTQLGYEIYTIQLKYGEFDQRTLATFQSYCEANPTVLFFYKYFHSGAHDYDIGLFVSNHDELRAALIDIREKFPSITIESLFLTFEQLSPHNLPPAVFE